MEALGIIIYIRWKMSSDSKYMPVYTAKSAWIAVALPLPPLWAEKLPPTDVLVGGSRVLSQTLLPGTPPLRPRQPIAESRHGTKGPAL